jgi:tetratricopeptide (TPR) repeat protein
MIDLPGFRRLRELGGDGTGHVYLAEQARPARLVAIRVLLPALQRRGAGPGFVGAARRAVQLVHPNIARVYGAGEHAGASYSIVEHVDGGTLDDRLHRGISAAQALDACAQVAAALAHAHAHGVVHGGIRPANILFRGDGTAVLTDFAMAHAVSAVLPAALAVACLGTPHYVSPEQAAGRAVDARSDLYSLGVVLYHMLVGKVPFDAASALAIAVRHVTDPVPRLPSHLTDLQPLLDRLLVKDPAQRFQSAAELVSAIAALAPLRVSLARSRVRTGPVAPEEIRATQAAAESAAVEAAATGRSATAVRWRRLARHVARGLAAAAAVGLGLWVAHALEQRERNDDRVDREKEALVAGAAELAGDDPIGAVRLYASALVRDRNRSDRDIERAIAALRERIHADLVSRLDTAGRDAAERQAIAQRLEDAAGLFPEDVRFARIAQRLAAEQQIGDVLDRADAYVDGGALMEPAGASAFALYQQVLARSPGNARALAGLDRIAAAYLARAERSLAEGDVAPARDLADRARSSRPDHPGLPRVDAEIARRESRRATLLALGAQAAAALEQGALVAPAAPNARDLYQQALQLDPDYQPAREGLRAVGEALAARALRAVDTEQLDVAQRLTADAEALAPGIASTLAARSAVDAERERVTQVSTLLRDARARLAAGALSEPAHDSALALLQRVLELDPDNEPALALRRQVGTRLGSAAEAAWAAGNHALALSYARQAALADPDDARWRQLAERWRSGTGNPPH